MNAQWQQRYGFPLPADCVDLAIEMDFCRQHACRLDAVNAIDAALRRHQDLNTCADLRRHLEVVFQYENDASRRCGRALQKHMRFVWENVSEDL